ncbi:MAG: RNA ligase family protein [Candidatus Helarchaeota archaeon]
MENKYKKYKTICHLPNSKMGKNDKGIHSGMAIYCESKFRKDTRIIVTEKVDGSNVSIINDNNNFIALSKGGYECKGSSYEQHKLFEQKVNEWIKKDELNQKILPEGERVVFESLIIPHGTIYKKNPKYLLIDWIGKDGRKLWNEYNSFIDIKKVVTLYDGILPISVNNVLKVMPKKGLYGAKNGFEGLVYRIERNLKFDFLAKWVRHDYEQLKYQIK